MQMLSPIFLSVAVEGNGNRIYVNTDWVRSPDDHRSDSIRELTRQFNEKEKFAFFLSESESGFM